MSASCTRPAPARAAAGFTFVELMFAVALIVLTSVLLVANLALHYSNSREERDRMYAAIVARSLLSELHGQVEVGADLDRYDDGGRFSPALNLTLESDSGSESGPGTSLPRYSGNHHRNGGWVWLRRMRVESVRHAAAPSLRCVTVEVFKRDAAGEPRPKARLSTLVHGISSGLPTTQVLDLYLLAIEQLAPAGLDSLSLRPFVEAKISEFEQRHQGIEFRTHWITKLGYGRDPDHRAPTIVSPMAVRAWIRTAGKERNGFDPNRNPAPYTLAGFDNLAMQLPEARAHHERRMLHVAERRRAIEAAGSNTLTAPVPLSDMAEEPTWHLLLADLLAEPRRYRHALFLDLHGDVLPLPPISNIARAARDEVTLPGLRCVTHPQRVWTPREIDGDAAAGMALSWYVYAYREGDGTTGPGETPGVCPTAHPINLQVMGIDLTDPRHAGRLRRGVDLENLYGGVPIVVPGTDAPTYDYRPFHRAKDVYQPRGRNEMFYFAQFVDPGIGEEKYTLLQLYHTPLLAPPVQNSGTRRTHSWAEPVGNVVPGNAMPGLQAFADLPASGAALRIEADPHAGAVQGLVGAGTAPRRADYDPAPVGWDDVVGDLATPGPGRKNTARWRLTLPAAVLSEAILVDEHGRRSAASGDLRVTIETRFWTAGPALAHAPMVASNESVCHTFWAADRAAVPELEWIDTTGAIDPYVVVSDDDRRGRRTDGEMRPPAPGGGAPVVSTPTAVIAADLAAHRRRSTVDGRRLLAQCVGVGLLRSKSLFATTGLATHARLSFGGGEGGAETAPLDVPWAEVCGIAGRARLPDPAPGEFGDRLLAVLDSLVRAHDGLPHRAGPRVLLQAPVFDAREGRVCATWSVECRSEAMERNLRYRVLYSADAGRTWRSAVQGAAAAVAVAPWDAAGRADATGVQDQGPGPETIDWQLAPGMTLPDGVLVRVEAWRPEHPLHHGHHTRRLDVRRR